MAAEQLRAASDRILAECGKVIVGQEEVLEQLLIALFGAGARLLVGVPGLAKTLMIRTLADSMDLYVQPRPVHPGPDAVGHHRHRDAPGRPRHRARARSASCTGRSSPTSSWPTRSTARRRRRRPRCSKPCRSGRSRSPGTRHKLPDPFFVLATQNPIEQEGTYPLPEAQHDRFMFKINGRLPERGGRVPDHRIDHLLGEAAGRSRRVGRRVAGDAGAGAEGAGRRLRHPLRHEARAPDAPARPGRRAARPERAGLREEVRDLGGRPAGRAEPDPRRRRRGRCSRAGPTSPSRT